MKKIILSLVAILAFTTVFSQGINFEHTSFEEALSKAKKENKLVFMDCYTSWCGPCKKLSKEIFPLKEVGAIFNKNYVSIKMDMESKEGKKLAEKYNAHSYPTLLWLNTDGVMQHKTVGFVQAKVLIASAKQALSNDNWASLDKQFKAGERNDKFMQKYIRLAIKSEFDAKEAIDIYFAQKNKKELISMDGFNFSKDIIKSISNPFYIFVANNRDKYYILLGKDKVSNYLRDIMSREMAEVYYGKSKKVKEAKKKEALELDKIMATKEIAYAELYKLRDRRNAKKYIKALVDYSYKHEYDDYERLLINVLSIIFTLEKKEVDPELVSQAVKLVKHSIELNRNCENTMAYAILLLKQGKKIEAENKKKEAEGLAVNKENEEFLLWMKHYFK
jgi:thiol-disulfide isomerase/thioredoxin